MAAITFRVLGPLTVDVDGRAVRLGGPKPRQLLATLLLRPNVAVPTEALVDVLWPAAPPRSAGANVRTYVHGLRRLLDNRIEHAPAGYVLRADPEEIDLHRFERLVGEARRTNSLRLLDTACALWRGRFLEDLPQSHLWAPTLARLTEELLSAREQRLRILLDLGRQDGRLGDAVGELRGLLAEHPLREELWQLLVRVLAATGQRAEALRACADAERILRTELDTAPGPELRQLRTELAGDTVGPVCQLPLDLPDFTGRTALVGELVDMLRDREHPTVVVLSGPPGVGKSAVAVRVAHATRTEFPDGQLHLDLAGTSDKPRATQEVLSEVLRALGAATPPGDLAERSALLRTMLADRRMCIVLDDAASAAQVRPLLPGVGSSAVLVTSRVMLPDLPGARPVELDVLPSPEADQLLSRIIGTPAVRAEPESAAAILRFCGYLPLAIRVAGTRLRHRRGWTLRMMADRLADERRRLDELRVGELAVRASVNLSYAALAPDAALAFRRLGLLGPVRWPGWVVAALLDRSHADDVLDVLVDTHLVALVGADATGAPRYRLHDLLRCYAAELPDATADQRAAVRRVLGGYLALAVDAASRLPSQFLGVLASPVGGRRPEGVPVADPAAWFEAERRSGVAAVTLAESWGLDDLAWRLATAFTPYFDLRGRQDDWQRTHTVALAAVRRTGDRHGEAIVLRNVGQVALYRDAYAEARAAFAESHRLFALVGDQRGAGFALAGLGTVLRVLGEHERALDCCHAALTLFAQVADPHGEAVARLAAGSVWLELGCLAPAGRWFADAYALCAEIGDRHREAHALKRIAELHQRRGDLATARSHVARAIAIFTELADEHCVGYANQSLGELCLRSGELATARELLAGSLDTHRRTGDRRSEAEVALLLGRLHETLGEPIPARDYYERARTIQRSLAMP